MLIADRAVLADNVLFFIGDGMGFEQVKAARAFAGAPLCFETLPYRAQVSTYSADSSVTDSAASGTALATGVKVNNGVISLAYPGDGRELETLLEFAQARNMKVGLVTSAFLTHATPAAFGAHETSRNNYEAIATDYLRQTKPNILFGGGGNGLSVSASFLAGYSVVNDAASFASLDATKPLLSAQFGSSHLPYVADYLSGNYPYPRLPELVAKALEIMGSHAEGFFLMVEGGRIDHACHDNHLVRAVHEVLDFAAAVEVAMNWAAARQDTLVLVTADHETGGLKVVSDNGAEAYPAVTWSSTGHTGVNVPVYAWGKNAESVAGFMDNTDFSLLAQSVLRNVSPRVPSSPRNLEVILLP